MPGTPYYLPPYARRGVLFVLSGPSGVGKDALLTETGLDLDRAWMVVDEQGSYVTQRELPRMALVRPQLKLTEVVLRAPGMLALHLSIDTVEEAVKVRLWDDERPIQDTTTTETRTGMTKCARARGDFKVASS